MSLNHANHNLDVCNFLNNGDIQCNDWVITTAFYSALHFIEKGHVFPGEYSLPDGTSETYNTFDDYYESFSEYYNQTNRNTSPHRCRRYLVNQITEIEFEYNALADHCHNARYKNYVVSDVDKEECLSHLGFIKDFCST